MAEEEVKPATARKKSATATAATAPKRPAAPRKKAAESGAVLVVEPKKKPAAPRKKAAKPDSEAPVEAPALARKKSTNGAKSKPSLVIVESPSKAKTIERYLGKDYRVASSVGHIRDLPSSKLGVDVAEGFRPTYQVIKGKEKVVDQLRRAAAASSAVYLAPDPDREGEAIAWHIAAEIEGKNDNIQRVTFNEITPTAVRRALSAPKEINASLVNAQQARRVLDRLVGYSISPILWKKVQKGLSAGRVQSVAVRLIVDREREIEVFLPQEYWSIEAEVEKPGEEPGFTMKLAAIDGKKFEIGTEEEATRVVAELKNEKFKVDKLTAKQVSRNPYPPFITSTLQQEAARKLRFTTRNTMRLAQQLYEGVEIGDRGLTGLITYMRTDSTRVAGEAQAAAREFIVRTFSEEYVPETPNVYASRAGAQDAHEAVRPTYLDLPPEALEAYLDKDQFRLYRLVWNRFLASQMSQAKMEQTRVETLLLEGKYTFTASGSVILFPGFLAAYEESKDERTDESETAERKLPRLVEGDALKRKTLLPLQHFTQPPPRYSESSLVKELEALGIGRPSTYAAIIQTIQERKYVEKVKSRFVPTESGRVVTDLLTESFPEIMDVKFTALMEDQLDHVEDGSVNWVTLLQNFYESFRKRLETAATDMRDVRAEIIKTDILCEKCGAPMIVRWGRNGRFLSCSAFPKCRNAKPYTSDEQGNIQAIEPDPTDEVCDKCNSPMLIRAGRRGRFLACSAYPTCKNTRPVPIGVPCPMGECGGRLVERRSKRGKTFYACDQYPTCRFVVWEHPRQERCLQCSLTVNLIGKKGKESVFACGRENCPYEAISVEATAEAVSQEAE